MYFETRGLGKSFGGLRAVDDVSFSLDRGQIKAIIGPNGAGKTTVFNLVTGFIRPDRGQVLFKGNPIHRLRPHQIAKMGMIRTFQGIQAFKEMTVLENVTIGLHRFSRYYPWDAVLNLGRATKEDERHRRRAEELLLAFGLDTLADAEAGSLSFGQQKLVELACAAAAQPELTLLDEPASGLSMQEVDNVARHLRGLRDAGMTLLVVEHQMRLVMEIADEILVLDHGRKIAEGSPAEVKADREVQRIYLGE